MIITETYLASDEQEKLFHALVKHSKTGEIQQFNDLLNIRWDVAKVTLMDGIPLIDAVEGKECKELVNCVLNPELSDTFIQLSRLAKADDEDQFKALLAEYPKVLDYKLHNTEYLITWIKDEKYKTFITDFNFELTYHNPEERAIAREVYNNNMKVRELIHDNKPEEFKVFIKAHPEVLNPKESKYTLMGHSISSDSEIDFIRILIANGVVPTDFDVFYAVYYNCIDVVKLFIAMGYPIDNECGQKDSTGNMFDKDWRPLYHAVNVGYFEIVKLLVEAGADIEHKMSGGWMDGWDAINMAHYRERHPEVLEYLKQAIEERNAKPEQN